jgi:putative ABC transport system ATP-binding protein
MNPSADVRRVICLQAVTRTFAGATAPLTALDGISLEVEAGEFLVISGPSGSGKSTLLALLSGIDRPSSGRVRVAETDIEGLSESAMSAWRAQAVGIVFQFFQLLPNLSALENVMLPMDFLGRLAGPRRRQRAFDLLDRLGVADQADKRPATLSGGQQQRVAIARALANEPAVVLADEPTGNLDSNNAQMILELFAGLAAEGQTVVMVTHDASARVLASRSIVLQDGRIVAGPAHA